MSQSHRPDRPTTIDPLMSLMRRFVVDWLDRADERVCSEIMDPGYTVHIGGTVLDGREAYATATTGQLAKFPGLMITVHDLFASEGKVALRFTEHGASADGGEAAWRGIGLFWSDGRCLVRNVTEEDYLARRRQLVDGVCDPVDPPMAAPWTQRPAEPDPAAETAVRTWLESGGPVGAEPGLVLDDARDGVLAPPVLEVERCDVGELFSAGSRVAFQAVQHGRFAGGIPGLDEQIGREATVGVVGMVAVGPDGGIAGHVVRDRLSLRRSLRR